MRVHAGRLIMQSTQLPPPAAGPSSRPGKASPIVVVLLGGILVALVALVVVLAKRGEPTPDAKAATQTALDKGAIQTFPGEERKALDTHRVQQTYLPGAPTVPS